MLSSNSSVLISSNVELPYAILSHMYELTITSYKFDVKSNKMTYSSDIGIEHDVIFGDQS